MSGFNFFIFSGENSACTANQDLKNIGEVVPSLHSFYGKRKKQRNCYRSS